MTELYRLSARDMAARLKSGEIGPTEAVEAAYRRIEAVDGRMHAMPTLCKERALAHARRIEAEDSVTRRDDPRWLAGLPVAVKDLVDVEGVRTTYGSPIFKDHVPDRSDILVERLEDNGAIVVGKSNTPEFGAGGNSFNEVFEATRNPHDLRLSAAGSSGGSAAALAAGEVWLATGSDMGGSLRTPAAFCGVVGLRPSPGRIARHPNALPFETLSVEGPMARDVADTALLLDAMAGLDPRDPLSIPAPAEPFQNAVREDAGRPKAVWAGGLGVSPVDSQVEAVCRAALAKLEASGWRIEERCPDFSNAMEAFHALRAPAFLAGLGEHYESNRDLVKPEIQWNIELGMKQTAGDIALAERRRGLLFQRMAELFETADVMIAPAAVIPPYPVAQRYPESFAGQSSETYLDWLALAGAITLTASPSIAIPAGRTAEGLPVGIQLVGPPRAEYALLRLAQAAETAVESGFGAPVDPA